MKGPTEIKILSCVGCQWHIVVEDMHGCAHEDAAAFDSGQRIGRYEDGRFMRGVVFGNDATTPWWCPCLTGE